MRALAGLVKVIGTTLVSNGLMGCGGIIYPHVSYAPVRLMQSDAPELMCGRFTSVRTAGETECVDLTITRLWQERGDGIWLLVEQSGFSEIGSCRKARVYRLADKGRERAQVEGYSLAERALYGPASEVSTEQLGSLMVSYPVSHMPTRISGLEVPDEVEPGIWVTRTLRATPNRLMWVDEWLGCRGWVQAWTFSRTEAAAR